MILIYFAMSAIIIIFTAVFKKYHIEYKKDIIKKEHPLRLFYGLCFFLTDIYAKIYRKRKPNGTEPFHSLKTKIQMLHPGKNISAVVYTSIARRLSASLAVFLFFMLAGASYSIGNLLTSDNNVTELSRPTDGSDSVTYTLVADTDETTELIDIDISKKMYEYSEIISLFDKYREDILSAMLGDNVSSEYITKPLNFPSSIGDEGISLSWQPENLSYIDLNGGLLYENISPEGTHTCIYITMKLEDVEATLIAGVILYPDTSDASSLIHTELMNYINENNNPYSATVLLPSSISGNDITFSLPENNNKLMFFPIGIFICIILFFAASKEINSKIKVRNSQMLSDYPEIVSKLLLLLNAGLNIRNAFKKIVDDYYKGLSSGDTPHYAYEELSITINSLNSGKSEATAYTDYGKRCGLMPYMKLGSILEQNLNKGVKEMRFHLNNEVKNAFQNYKAEIITKSKQAETKLILPMVFILVVIMVLIMVPSFMNI